MSAWSETLRPETLESDNLATWATWNKFAGSSIKNENITNKELAEELHKTIFKKFKKRKVHSSFTDNILGANLADMELISKFKKGFRILFCVIDIYSKYAWVFRLKGKKELQLPMILKKSLKESNCKPNRIWEDKGSEFYNRSMKSWSEKNTIEMYSTHNGERSIITEGFIRRLKNKIDKYITLISKIVYIDKLDDEVNKYNNTYHKRIKMKPVDVKPTYINSSKEINDEDPKFENWWYC